MAKQGNYKALVLFSGGLDSRLVIKILKEQGFTVIALHIKLPFGGGCGNLLEDSFNFLREERVKLKILDCTRGVLLQDYLDVIKNPKYKRGKGYNPCQDCKIFLFKKAKEVLEETGADLIVTGEVLGQRPMSQMMNSLMIDEQDAGLERRILRPLSARLLPKTIYEEEGIVDRNKLLDLKGRNRKRQMELAKKYGINYPNPAGGCLLCERFLKDRFKFLLGRGLSDETVKLVNVGRHFVINGSWIVLGRNEKENDILKSINEGTFFEPSFIGPSARVFGNFEIKELERLVRAYSKQSHIEERGKWKKYQL